MPISLPAELFYQIARHLSDVSDPDLAPLDHFDLFPWATPPLGAGAKAGRKTAKQTLLSLSSTCRDLRSLVSSFIWRHVVIRSQRDVKFMLDLADFHATRREYPLRSVRALSVIAPQKIDVVPLLLRLLDNDTDSPSRTAHLSPDASEASARCRLARLVWHAGEQPPPKLVWSFAPDLLWVDVTCGTFWPGDAQWAQLHQLRILSLSEFEAFLLPPHLPTLLLATIQPRGSGTATQKRVNGDSHPESGPLHGRHLDGQDAEVERSFDSVRRALVDRHFQMATGVPPRQYLSALEHLRLLGTKCSILHCLDLIRAGCYANLKSLDVYPVTPLAPLSNALASAQHLQHLSLTLDVSGSYGNYERFWDDLCRPLRVFGSTASTLENVPLGNLTHLRADPVPTPSTAPSFASFLLSHPALVQVNGLPPHVVLAAFRAQEHMPWAPDVPGDGALRTDAPALVGALD